MNQQMKSEQFEYRRYNESNWFVNYSLQLVSWLSLFTKSSWPLCMVTNHRRIWKRYFFLFLIFPSSRVDLTWNSRLGFFFRSFYPEWFVFHLSIRCWYEPNPVTSSDAEDISRNCFVWCLAWSMKHVLRLTSWEGRAKII